MWPFVSSWSLETFNIHGQTTEWVAFYFSALQSPGGPHILFGKYCDGFEAMGRMPCWVHGLHQIATGRSMHVAVHLCAVRCRSCTSWLGHATCKKSFTCLAGSLFPFSPHEDIGWVISLAIYKFLSPVRVGLYKPLSVYMFGPLRGQNLYQLRGLANGRSCHKFFAHAYGGLIPATRAPVKFSFTLWGVRGL